MPAPQNILALLARSRGLNLMPPQPAPIQNTPAYPMSMPEIYNNINNSPPDVGYMPPMNDFDLPDISASQGDAEIPTSQIAPKIQEWLGAKEPDMGSIAQQLLSMRQDPSLQDAADAATDSFVNGKSVSAQSIADNRFTDDFKTMAALSKLQNDSQRLKILGQGGSSVFAQTMAAINADPDLMNLSAMDKIRLAQNKVGTNLTMGPNGQVSDMSGAAGGLGNLENGKETGKNDADLIGKPLIAGAVTTSEGQAKRLNDAPQAMSALNSALAGHTLVSDTIDRVIPNVNVWTSGFAGQPLSSIPGTAASNLKANLETIKANIGFDKLAEMRANSPTGGALGNISDTENRLLASTWANIENAQSPEQLTYNLQNLKVQIKQANQRLRQAYEQDYGTLQGAPQLPQQSQSVDQDLLQYMTPEEKALFQ